LHVKVEFTKQDQKAGQIPTLLNDGLLSPGMNLS